MADIGLALESGSLTVVAGRDFKWSIVHLDDNDQPSNYPAGDLYIEFPETSPVTKWFFTIAGSLATLKVEHTAVALIPDRSNCQLVFLPTGEAAGGDPEWIGRLQRLGK